MASCFTFLTVGLREETVLFAYGSLKQYDSKAPMDQCSQCSLSSLRSQVSDQQTNRKWGATVGFEQHYSFQQQKTPISCLFKGPILPRKHGTKAQLIWKEPEFLGTHGRAPQNLTLWPSPAELVGVESGPGSSLPQTGRDHVALGHGILETSVISRAPRRRSGVSERPVST